MTLPPYTRTREGEVPPGSWPQTLSAGPWSEALSSYETVKHTLGNSSGAAWPSASPPCHESSRRFGTGVLKSKRKDKRNSERGKKGGKGGKARPPEGYLREKTFL